MAAASGKGLRKGASATIAIEWAWGQKAQPDIRAHLGHIEAWLKYYDEHKGDEMPRIRKAWKVAYRRATEATKQGQKESTTMRSAMSACIVSLRKVGLLPVEPDRLGLQVTTCERSL